MLKTFIIGLCTLLPAAAHATACGDPLEIAYGPSGTVAVGATASGETSIIEVNDVNVPRAVWFLYNLNLLETMSVHCGGSGASGSAATIEGLTISLDIDCVAYSASAKVRKLSIRGLARVTSGAFDVISQSFTSTGSPALAQAGVSVETNATDIYVQARGVPGKPLQWACRAPSTFAYKSAGGF